VACETCDATPTCGASLAATNIAETLQPAAPAQCLADPDGAQQLEPGASVTDAISAG